MSVESVQEEKETARMLASEVRHIAARIQLLLSSSDYDIQDKLEDIAWKLDNW